MNPTAEQFPALCKLYDLGVTNLNRLRRTLIDQSTNRTSMIQSPVATSPAIRVCRASKPALLLDHRRRYRYRDCRSEIVSGDYMRIGSQAWDMPEIPCQRCGVSIDMETDAYYQRIPPDSAPDATDTLFFCSPRCVYKYTGKHLE